VARATDTPDTAFLVFEITDLAKAKAFINAPEAKQAGQESGVLEGEYHFVEDAKR